MKYFIYDGSWNTPLDSTLDSENTLVLLFSTYNAKTVQKPLDEINAAFKNSFIIGSSTSGNILMDELKEDSLVMAVLQFSTTKLQLSTKKITATKQSFIIGQEIAQDLNAADLQALFILSDGLNINGSQLTEGLSSVLPPKIKTSGALGGDNEEFLSTWIVVNGKAVEHYVSAIGFYGEDIHFGYASKDGLDKFGVQRVVTRSKDNILYELDGKPALELYKQYLGDKAKDLPASGLYFPISIENEDYKEVIRTILAVNHEENSITFAGDVPQGSYVTFMKANYDRIIDAATEAASELLLEDYNGEALLNIAVSCVGRKLTLKQRVEEELEATLDILPKETLQIGLYSYGEISPTNQKCCELHNQTMTLTTIWEKDA
jgi:hypothetical protein